MIEGDGRSESGWKIKYHPLVVRDDIPRLDGGMRKRVKKAIEGRLATAPQDYAKPLAYTLAGLWSLRVGAWRVIFIVQDSVVQDRAVTILKIGHRRDVYDKLVRRVPPGEAEPDSSIE